MRKLLAQIDAGDIGLMLMACGCAWLSVPLALIVVGALLVLQKRPLRSWF